MKIKVVVGKVVLLHYFIGSLLGAWWGGTTEENELKAWGAMALFAAYGLIYSDRQKHALVAGVIAFSMSFVVVLRCIYLYSTGVLDFPHTPYYIIILPGLFFVYLSPLIDLIVLKIKNKK